MQTTKNQNMAGTKVQTSKVWKCPIFPDLARFSGETGFQNKWELKRKEEMLFIGIQMEDQWLSMISWELNWTEHNSVP